ncbi:N-acetylneuraminate synthase family protein [Nitrosarchaeum sp.]|uniref:N-acetylneuraminate synthase family protein n=1 Tax=Nitrosarchaeum sp. TaxID=2026886 RepID=UPI00247B7A7E|nr:N-acetylneuraminate synthase family protein [Nitrosarchaeum sp.]MCV0411929.1 N-acetylneuraminate synthase family protein [Nitrosarchaeum sp.]
MEYTFKNQIIIDNQKIGFNNPCYIIAEIGINHNGDLELAKKLIDAAVYAGVNAVKFQKRHLDNIYQKNILENPTLESQGTEILIEVLKEVEFTDDDFKKIISYCKEKSITFLCTPWDIPSVDFLERFNVPAYKISSADLTNFPLIKYISKLKKPMIISTGMSTIEEIEKTVDFVKNENVPLILLHCNSTYPSPIDLLNLSLIPTLREKFNIPIGYSGHESEITPSIMAANIGSIVIERHITLDKTMKGLDQAASLEPNDFKKLVQEIRICEKAKGNPIKKMTRGEILQREVLGKSIVCSSDIKRGDIFSERNIDVKTPARGISPQYYFELIGKKSTRDIKKGEYLQMDDLK